MESRPTSYSDLLGAAFDVSAEPSRFADLLEVASNYFFGSPEEDQSTHSQLDPHLERRSLQIARLLEQDLRLHNATSVEPFHARLEIDIRTLVVRGNHAAAQLTQCTFPCKIGDLPFDHETHRTVRQNILGAANPEGARDEIILAMIEASTVQSYLALIQRPKNGAGTVVLSMSYIDWSDELLSRLGEAFGLTPSEQDVLGASLQGKSRKDIARGRGTTEETVKAQTRSIITKTNASRMSDVVQLSASIAYLLRDQPNNTVNENLLDWETPTDHMQFLERAGERQLAYYRYGRGTKVVLFVHGFIQGPFFTKGFLKELARNDISMFCPSRPGFGYTTLSSSRATHNRCVVQDALALVAHEDLTDVTIVTHQGGVSHAFRIAAALGSRVRGMVMIDAGIPINEDKHLSEMDRLTRLAGAASKHAPSVMAMIINLGIPVYKKRGIKAFLQEYLKDSPLDLLSLADPEILALCAAGCFHLAQDGSEAWVRDGASAMSDWQQDFDRVSCPQVWIHPDTCPIMKLEFVEQFLSDKLNQKAHVIPDAGLNVLYQSPQSVMEHLLEAMSVPKSI